MKTSRILGYFCFNVIQNSFDLTFNTFIICSFCDIVFQLKIIAKNTSVINCLILSLILILLLMLPMLPMLLMLLMYEFQIIIHIIIFYEYTTWMYYHNY